MPDRGNRHLSGCDRSATDQRLGAYRLRELVAARGDVGLWLADHDDDGASLLRLFPGPPTLDEWRTF